MIAEVTLVAKGSSRSSITNFAKELSDRHDEKKTRGSWRLWSV